MNAAMKQLHQSPPDGDEKADKELDAKLADPTLCIEEKLIAVFGRCLDRYTAAVEKQTQKIARMQQGNDGDKSSIDVEVMQLKRLEDKRTEMLETGRKILGHYFGNAGQVTQSMSR